jgi:hypothetical protein
MESGFETIAKNEPEVCMNIFQGFNYVSTAKKAVENFLFENSGYETESHITCIATIPESDGNEFVVTVYIGNEPHRLVARVHQQPINPFVVVTSDEGDYWQSLIRDLRDVR